MYLNHLHNFRGMAICGIVGAHALQSFDWSGSDASYRIADTLFNESSVWFFFIAGFLFQYLSPKYKTKKYYIGKIKNVILPYLWLSIPALYVFTLVMPQNSVPPGFYDHSTGMQIVLFLLTGKHLEPFWFVPTITLIYLLAPLLLWLDRRVWPYLALPPLMVLSAWLGRDGLLIETGLTGMWSPVAKAVYLLSVYCFGMFLARFHDRFLRVMPRLWLPLAVMMAAAFAANVEYYDEQVHWMYVFKILACPLIVYGLHVWDEHVPAKIGLLGSLSFGLFFVHGYVLAAQKVAWSGVLGLPMPHGNAVSYVLYTAAVLAVCAVLLITVRRICGPQSRMLIGC